MSGYRMVVRTLEGPTALERDDFEPSAPGPGEVLIAVRAAGVNFFDALITAGKYQRKPDLPFAPGAELSGEVVSVGKGVEIRPGSRVIALVDHGAYTSHLSVMADRVFELPESMSFDEGAAFGIVYQTSYFGLVHRALTQPGETVLVHAAAGGVGLAAVQIARALGAKVIGTASSEEKLELIREHGADLALSYRDASWVDAVKEFTGGRGADVIYDPVGGDIFDLSTKCIAFDGRLVVIGFASGRIPSISMNRVLLKNIAVTGLHWGAYFDHDRSKVLQAHEALCQMAARGEIRPFVSRHLPLEEAAKALTDLSGRKTLGKLVLRP